MSKSIWTTDAQIEATLDLLKAMGPLINEIEESPNRMAIDGTTPIWLFRDQWLEMVKYYNHLRDEFPELKSPPQFQYLTGELLTHWTGEANETDNLISRDTPNPT